MANSINAYINVLEFSLCIFIVMIACYIKTFQTSKHWTMRIYLHQTPPFHCPLPHLTFCSISLLSCPSGQIHFYFHVTYTHTTMNLYKINGHIRQNTCFSDWLNLLNMMTCSHSPESDITSFFTDEKTPLCISITFSLFISTAIHLGCFHNLAIMGKVVLQ